MAIERKTVLDKLEIFADGSIQIRMALQLVDGDQVLSTKFHRTAVVGEESVTAALSQVAAGLQAQGWAPMAAEEVGDVDEVVKVLRPRLKARGKLAGKVTRP